MKATNYTNNNGESYDNKNGTEISIDNLSSAKNEYKDKFIVTKEQLKYQGHKLTEEEKTWLKELGIEKYVYKLENGKHGVTISGGELSINKEEFDLEDIELSEEMGYADFDVFSDKDIRSVIIPEDTFFSIGMFSNCKKLTDVICLTDSINIDAFCGCSSLTSVTLSSNLTLINAESFSGCSSLSDITIPENVTYIGMNCFYGCTSLTRLTINGTARFTEEQVKKWGIDTSKVTIEGTGYKG